MTGIRVLNGAAAVTVGGGKRDETATVLYEVIVRRRTKSTRTPFSTKPLELNISRAMQLVTIVGWRRACQRRSIRDTDFRDLEHLLCYFAVVDGGNLEVVSHLPLRGS
jgi:hypothetical protein